LAVFVRAYVPPLPDTRNASNHLMASSTNHPSREEIDESQLLLKRLSNELNSELSPGLIHEVNNILTGIYFNLEGCQEALDPSSHAIELIKEINRGVERIKEILGRATQIQLNSAEREVSYHDLEALVAGQLDLMRIVFPKTSKINFTPSSQTIHVRTAEFPFRVALLTMAARLRGLFPAGKNDIRLAILGPEEVSKATGEKGGFAAVEISIPCLAETTDEIDEFLFCATPGDISLKNVEVISAGFGGRVMICPGADRSSSKIMLVLPIYDLQA